jgi:hypothetical protein
MSKVLSKEEFKQRFLEELAKKRRIMESELNDYMIKRAFRRRRRR